MDNAFTIKLVKKGNKLVHQNTGELALYKEFLNSLEEGQVVESFFDAGTDDGSNAQLAKIHVLLKKLATTTGHTVAELKKHLKKENGLCWNTKDGEEYCKSFGECSKEELTLVIETLREWCDDNGISF
jgi:hypothetical protein